MGKGNVNIPYFCFLFWKYFCSFAEKNEDWWFFDLSLYHQCI